MDFAYLVQTNIKVKDTYFHTGEITTMSPSKPATVGALVDVQVLQVNVHTNNTSVRKKNMKTESKPMIWCKEEKALLVNKKNYEWALYVVSRYIIKVVKYDVYIFK